MNLFKNTTNSSKPILLLIVTLLCCQLLGNYFAGQFLRFDSFLGLWPILRILIPILIIILIGIPFKVLYLNKPQFCKQSLIFLTGVSFALVALFIYLNWFGDGYLSHYRKGRTLEQLQAMGKFQSFMIFTSSTLIAWEFFHRCFLLAGSQYIMTRFMQIPASSATVLAMLFTCIFEAMFHIKKPIYEAIPMVLASLALSWLTIKTRSIWPALLIHLAIEVIFGHAAYVGV